MRKLATFTAVIALAVFGFASAANADEYADTVNNFALPDLGCLVGGGTCDVTGDNADGGTDALGAPNGNAADNTTFTSLGFDTNLGLGGVLILDFTDNVCLDDGTGAVDFTVNEVVETAENYSVAIGLQGAALTTLVAAGTGTTSFDNEGVAAFNQTRITALAGPDTNPTGGADIDAVSCLFTLDQADIEKAIVGDDDIDIGVDFQQSFSFTITITNNTVIDGGLASLNFLDVVPAEFDVTDATVTAEPEANDCSASAAEGGAKGKGKGNQKLAPDIVTITAAGLNDGESCTITVDVSTDGDHPGRGNSPDFTPTSCPAGGEIVLNEGVKVFDSSFNLLFQDDDTLGLTCVFPI